MNLGRALLWSTAAAAVAAGAVAAYATLLLSPSRPQFEAVDITGAPWGSAFELTDHLGKKRTLGDFRGKVVALFFGYTHCPDMCPTTLAVLGQSVRMLGSDADQVQGLFVTVDPRRDTPQVLAQYVPAFHASFLGLYADDEAIARTLREFKGYVHANAPNEQGSYTVDHSAQVYVFDRQGRIRLYVKPDAMSAESIARDLHTLLREGES